MKRYLLMGLAMCFFIGCAHEFGEEGHWDVEAQGRAISSPDSRSVGPQSVNALLIWDADTAETAALVAALEGAGVTVTMSDTNESGWDGSNPPPTGFDAVIHLNGTTWRTEMPVAGQNALVSFVQNGGNYVSGEWNAFQLHRGEMTAMQDLILFDTNQSGLKGTITYNVIAEQADHPVVSNVPASFSFNTSWSRTYVHSFDTEPATVLVKQGYYVDAVAVREFGEGRVVEFNHTANSMSSTPLTDPNVQQLYINGVFWGIELYKPPILVIWDENDANLQSLVSKLETDGYDVTLSDTNESSYDGTNPVPTDFDAIIHLNGSTPKTVMPEAGQNALVAYVQDGGGFISGEWNAYQIDDYMAMRDLILIDRSGGRDGNVTYTVTDASHPVMAGLPTDFTFPAGTNVGTIHEFDSPDVATVLAVDDSGSDAVAVRLWSDGRIVGFNHAAHYKSHATLSDANVQQLYSNAVCWAAAICDN
jgi:trehalose utilization protein